MPTRQTADYDPLMDELPPELAVEYMAEKRRRKISEAMLGQSQTPLVAPEVKGRFQGAISPWQGIAKIAQAYMANKGLEGSEGRIADIGKRNADMQAEAVSQYKKNTIGTPNVPMGPPTEEGAMGVSPGFAPTPEQRQAAIADAMIASNPRLNKMGALDFARDTKKEDRASATEDKLFQLELIHKQELERIKERAIEQRISKEEAQAQMIAANERNARLIASLRQPAAPIQLTDAAGNVKLVDQRGNTIKDLGAVGKPSAGFEKAGAAKKKMAGDLDTAITELEKATTDGGLIDKSTGSGAGAAVDAVAGFFGKATPGAIAVGQTAPIFDLVLKMVPRFEGPQSDEDTLSYKDAAGQLANPKTPNEIKKAAGKEILRLMKKRKGQFIDKAIEGTDADIPSAPGSSVDALLEKYK